MKKYIILFLLLFSLPMYSQQVESIGSKGLTLGSTKEQVYETIQSKNAKLKYGETTQSDLWQLDSVFVGSTVMMDVSLYFFHNKLYMASFITNYDFGNEDDILGGLKSKYGKVSKTKKDKFKDEDRQEWFWYPKLKGSKDKFEINFRKIDFSRTYNIFYLNSTKYDQSEKEENKNDY